MSQAFKTSLPSTQKLVLLALCDCANDQGECYPSVSALQAKCSLSDRGVQKAVAELESMGYLRRETRNGRSTVYWLTPERGSPRTTFTPNDVHPTPERRSPPPPNVVHPTPERGSPITIKEPSVEPSRKRSSPAPERPPEVSEQVWNDWITLRKTKRSAVTETVIKMARRESLKAGIPLEVFFSIWCYRGSQGLEAAWIKPNEISRFSGGRKHAGFSDIDYRSGVNEDGTIA